MKNPWEGFDHGSSALCWLLLSHPMLGMALGGTAAFVDRMRLRGRNLNLPQGAQLNYQLTREVVLQR